MDGDVTTRHGHTWENTPQKWSQKNATNTQIVLLQQSLSAPGAYLFVGGGGRVAASHGPSAAAAHTLRLRLILASRRIGIAKALRVCTAVVARPRVGMNPALAAEGGGRRWGAGRAGRGDDRGVRDGSLGAGRGRSFAAGGAGGRSHREIGHGNLDLCRIKKIYMSNDISEQAARWVCKETWDDRKEECQWEDKRH